MKLALRTSRQHAGDADVEKPPVCVERTGHLMPTICWDFVAQCRADVLRHVAVCCLYQLYHDLFYTTKRTKSKIQSKRKERDVTDLVILNDAHRL